MAALLNMAPDTEVEPHLAAHLHHLRKRNQAPRSIQERRFAILRVARYLGHPVFDATRAELEAWQDIRTEDLTPAGMNNELIHVGQYFKWATVAQLRDDNPATVLITPRKPSQSLPHPMPDTDIARALARADATLHAWIGLGAFCGLRCMEIGKLAREDIAGGHLRIVGKGRKERDVPLPSSLADELRDGPFNPTGHLFSRIDGKPGPPSAMRVSERINDHLHSIGIRLTAHALRHRYGTKLYEATLDLLYVAQVMGHSSTQTTMGYVLLLANNSPAIEAISHLAA